MPGQQLRNDHLHSLADIIDFEASPPAPVEVGGTVTTRTVGPYQVDFDSPGLALDASAGIAVGVPLTEGEIVIDGFCFVTEAFDGSDPPSAVQLGVSPTDNLTTSIQVASFSGEEANETQAQPTESLRAARVASDMTLSLFVYAPDATGGSALVYALIGRPDAE